MTLPERSSPAKQSIHDVGNRSNIVFVTVCSKARKPIFNHEDIHELLRGIWQSDELWLVGKYVILPDHIHLFCAPARAEHCSVRKWIQYWKAQASRAWPRQDEKPLWQAQAWDRQLRQGDSYSQKWEYVRSNPVRHGLVDIAEDWPYQGEINVLRWHD